MYEYDLNRRTFLQRGAAGLGALAALGPGALAKADSTPARQPYSGPNVIIIRFGGGVRRRETIAYPHKTYCPFVVHELIKRGTLYPNMEISELKGVDTSHGQGTLHILTGQYGRYKNVSLDQISGRFESAVPTLFEYFRKTYAVPEHKALIINGEDRTDEEFYNFSNHHLFGVRFRSNTLSLYRFKLYLRRLQLQRDNLTDERREELKKELAELEAVDHRTDGDNRQTPEIEAFWERWRRYYGESGFVNPRGDRLLTELTVRALRELRPKLLMVNYNDPDYVHWGIPSHYTRGIAVIDAGIKRLYETVQADPVYRGNTVFVIVPDCGRDDNRLMRVPYQHHFNSKSSHEIFALMVGPGIGKGQVVDRAVDQCHVAGTVGRLMNMSTPFAENAVLEEAFV